MGKKKTTNKKGQKDCVDDLMRAMDAEIAQVKAQVKAENKANDKKFLMVLCGGALLWLSYLLLWWSSGLWLGKNGFLVGRVGLRHDWHTAFRM